MTKFKCLNCIESCCSKKVVVLTDADIRRLSNVGDPLNFVMFRGDMSTAPQVQGTSHVGAMTLKQENGSCIFLEDSMCSIHEFRPTACRMYPFDPLIIERINGHSIDIRIDYECPGIGIGEEYDPMPIIEQWREERLKYDLLVSEWYGDLVEFVRRCENDY